MGFSLDGVGLVHANGYRALADIRLNLAAGERVALIGASGAGILRDITVNPAHKEIMALQRASRFIPTKAENYKDAPVAGDELVLLAGREAGAFEALAFEPDPGRTLVLADLDVGDDVRLQLVSLLVGDRA